MSIEKNNNWHGTINQKSGLLSVLSSCVVTRPLTHGVDPSGGGGEVTPHDMCRASVSFQFSKGPSSRHKKSSPFCKHICLNPTPSAGGYLTPTPKCRYRASFGIFIFEAKWEIYLTSWDRVWCASASAPKMTEWMVMSVGSDNLKFLGQFLCPALSAL
jgi:hypothetical protein